MCKRLASDAMTCCYRKEINLNKKILNMGLNEMEAVDTQAGHEN